MRIIFSAGGTGGHVNPAIAIAEKIRERYPEAEILFVGREGGRENRTVTDSGFKIIYDFCTGTAEHAAGFIIRNKIYISSCPFN